MANEAANVDLISEGRLILGLGIAAKVPTVRAEFEACGVSIDHRLGIFEETVTLMRRLWSEPSVTFNGRHFQLQDVGLGLRPHNGSSIPIWIAGSVDNALRRVARLGDGWYPQSRVAAGVGRAVTPTGRLRSRGGARTLRNCTAACTPP